MFFFKIDSVSLKIIFVICHAYNSNYTLQLYLPLNTQGVSVTSPDFYSSDIRTRFEWC